ncbi:MAG: ASCH domain-containing protein [Nanopusillaceae archaeon]
MKNLQFLGIYRNALISGKKRITIRITKPNLRKGDIFIAHCGGKVIGKFKVTNVYTKKLREITEEEAKLDGFESKERLIKELKKYYPKIKEDTEIFVIEFEPVEIFKKEISSEDFAWGGKKINLIELAKLILEKDESLTQKQKELLKILIEEKSLRKAALRLGSLNKRTIFRKILREGYKRLKEKGYIN